MRPDIDATIKTHTQLGKFWKPRQGLKTLKRKILKIKTQRPTATGRDNDNYDILKIFRHVYVN